MLKVNQFIKIRGDEEEPAGYGKVIGILNIEETTDNLRCYRIKMLEKAIWACPNVEWFQFPATPIVLEYRGFEIFLVRDNVFRTQT